MRPSPVLSARLRFTTKQVGKGFYRGTKGGALGAHTEYGNYIIDWRKVRHYNVPDLTGFKLSPFVTNEMEPTSRTQTLYDGTTYTPPRVDSKEFLRQWMKGNPAELDHILQHQEAEAASYAQSKEELLPKQESLSESDDAHVNDATKRLLEASAKTARG